MSKNDSNVSLATTKSGSGSSSSTAASIEHKLSLDIVRRFRIEKKLGNGSFGHVYLAVDQTNRKYALKHIQIHATIRHYYEYFDFEVKSMMEMDHENVLRCLEVIRSSNEINMLFDVMEGGNMLELLQQQGNLSEDLTKFYFKQLCAAMQYIHGIHIVHCDIKPENILRASHEMRPVIKLTDFGLSRKFGENISTTTKHGAMLYASPELLRSNPFSPKVDIWSAGVTLYVMLSGVLPFTSSDAFLKGNYSFDGQNFENVSDSAKELIRKMLTVDPIDRLSIERVASNEFVQ